MSTSRLRTAIVLVIAVFALAACRPRLAPPPPPPVVTASSAETTQALFNAHNTLTGFSYTGDIGASMKAQWASSVLAASSTCGTLVHTSQAQLLSWYPGGGGENLFCWNVSSGCPTGQAAGEAAVRAWIASAPHYSIMQQFNGRYIGVGASCRNGTTWFAVAHFHN
jgi:hypothetical protein